LPAQLPAWLLNRLLDRTDQAHADRVPTPYVRPPSGQPGSVPTGTVPAEAARPVPAPRTDGIRNTPP
jgi:hypothetical protein